MRHAPYSFMPNPVREPSFLSQTLISSSALHQSPPPHHPNLTVRPHSLHITFSHTLYYNPSLPSLKPSNLPHQPQLDQRHSVFRALIPYRHTESVMYCLLARLLIAPLRISSPLRRELDTTLARTLPPPTSANGASSSGYSPPAYIPYVTFVQSRLDRNSTLSSDTCIFNS